ncbi:MAG TPA: prephenate dehydrogenase/arogenate dehydrogenase family protein [Spongiibacteraceae bacterium]|nr:prephenate dehydrogenase/arogenate dehydrogenase family protein [Spongiibacteraceae bacterium]
MTAEFGRITILGLGLIGGSLAKALKKVGAVREVVAWGHREASLQAGVQLGIIDSYSLDLGEAISGSDVIVIATPTLIAETMLAQLAPLFDSATLITDVASVKGNLQRAAEKIHGAMPSNLVLAHPIAGSEQSGVAAAKADLFIDHRVILTPAERTSTQALARIERMWSLTGADVSSMTVDEHDQILAATSHLPHVLAFALVDALAGAPEQRGIFRYAAGGFRDFTRIAGSDPKMWHDIALANRTSLLAALDLFTERLGSLRTAIERNDSAALMASFGRAKEARDEFAEELRKRASPSNIGDE